MAGRVLIVSSSVYPQRNGSAIVIENLVSALSPAEAAVFGELSPLAKPVVRGPDSVEFAYFRSRLSLGGRGARFLEPLRRRLLNRIVDRICRTAVERQCDRIMGVYPDELYCYAACLAAQQLEVPFFSYFHNTYADNTAISGKRPQKWQQQLFDSSQAVFTMSAGMQTHFEGTYDLPHCVPLRHTFAQYPSAPGEYTPPGPDRAVRLVAFGNFNESNIDATRRLVSAVRSSNQFELDVYTDVPPLLLRQRGIDPLVARHRGSLSGLSFDDMIARLRTYDAVVVTHGFHGGYGDVEYQTIFPTRTIPMLLCGRPVVVHSPPGSFLTNFFVQTEAGVVIQEADTNALLQGLQCVVRDHDLAGRQLGNAFKASEQFFAPNVVRTFRQCIFPEVGDASI